MRRGGKFYKGGQIRKFIVYFIRFSQYNRDNEFEERGTPSPAAAAAERMPI